MQNLFTKYFLGSCKKSFEKNFQNLLSLLEYQKNSVILDLGCDDGSFTLKFANKIGTKHIYGIEIVKEKIKQSSEKGIKVVCSDLNKKFPFENKYFDAVLANQVIEHIYDLDNLLSEMYRVTKDNGYLIISTENLSSWHNIVPLILGYQPFSLTNISKKGAVGNPFSPWNKTNSGHEILSSWHHDKVLSYFGLKDLLKKYGFSVDSVRTSGYYPFPNFLSRIDPVHSHLITIKARKINIR